MPSHLHLAGDASHVGSRLPQSQFDRLSLRVIEGWYSNIRTIAAQRYMGYHINSAYGNSLGPSRHALHTQPNQTAHCTPSHCSPQIYLAVVTPFQRFIPR